LPAFARMVAIDEDLDRIVRSAAASVDLLNRELPVRIAQLPIAATAPPEKMIWIDALGTELRITLTCDWQNRIAHLDVSAADERIVEAVLDAFGTHAAYGGLDEHLERLEALAEPEERQLVRVGLAGVERENDPGVLRVMSEAFRSPHAVHRKAATYATLILRWPALVQNLKEAIAREPDASLRGQMLEVVDHIGASGT
jgi:hypothetical protein